MASARELLQAAAQKLQAAQVPSPQIDAELLLAHVLNIHRGTLPSISQVQANEQREFDALVHRRAARIPLQHLTGHAYFRHLTLDVGPGVFLPRPETELLAQAAIDELPTSGAVVLDLCAGSGALAISIATEVPGTRVVAVELDDEAVVWLRRNVRSHREVLAQRGSVVEVVQGDASNPELLPEMVQAVDLVVANPPYIPTGMIPKDPEVREYDPHRALFGGEDGLDVIRGVVALAAKCLRPGGWIGIEHADVQGRSVPDLFSAPHWNDVSDHVDYNGLPRFTTARRGK